ERLRYVIQHPGQHHQVGLLCSHGLGQLQDVDRRLVSQVQAETCARHFERGSGPEVASDDLACAQGLEHERAQAVHRALVEATGRLQLEPAQELESAVERVV